MAAHSFGGGLTSWPNENKISYRRSAAPLGSSKPVTIWSLVSCSPRASATAAHRHLMTFGHPTGCLRQSMSASLRFPAQELSQGLRKKVKPLPSRAQGTATLKTPSSGQLLRDTRASKRHSYWKKFRCLQPFVLVSMSQAKLTGFWAAKTSALLK